MALKLLNDAYMDSDEEEDPDSSGVFGSRNGEGSQSSPNSDSMLLSNMEFLAVSTVGAGSEEASGSSTGEPPVSTRKLFGFPQCVDLTPSEQIKIPDETLRPVSPELEKKVAKLMEDQRRKNKTINEEIHKSKAFRNPSIYQKLIEFCGIDELGTNFAPEDFNPARWEESSSVEELAKAQAAAMEKYQREKKPSKEDANKRKSKWDSGQAAKQPANLLSLKMTGQAQVTRIPSSGNLSKSTK